MQSSRGRQSWTLALIIGAVVFGMVIAGGTNLTPLSVAAPDPMLARAVVVETPVVGGLPSFADLAAAVSPAVVSIHATTISDNPTRSGAPTNPFEFFFGPRMGPQGEQPRERRSDSSGSGFVISADGLIVTNHHVIEGATGLKVTLNGREYPAEIKGDDPATDLALLKIDAGDDLAFLRLGESENLRVGDWVMVIGSPLRLDNSVSVGVVSAKARSINITPDPSLESFIQTDAAINFGNSGGPLVDLTGAVVGIATAINYGAENIGFAVPVSTLKHVVPQLRERGSVRRGYLGVNIDDITFDRAQAFGLDSAKGVLVTEVREGGPAEEAGLEHGDIILRIDNRDILTNRDLIDYVSSLLPDTTVELEVFREGKTSTKKVKLGERPGTEAAVLPQAEEEGSSIEWLGIGYQDITPGLRSSHGLPEDLQGVVVVAVEPTSPLFDEQVQPGDIITEVNGRAITSVEDFERIVEGAESGAFLRFYLRRFDPRTGNSVPFFGFVRVP